MALDNFRILIVDDTASIHDDFRKILTPHKENVHQHLDQVNALLLGKGASSSHLPLFELDSAMQGQEALDKVIRSISDNKPYAVAFVDVLMPPGDDGISTIKHMWDIDPDIQVVICTAYSKYSWNDIVEALGQTDQLFILKKPFDNIEITQLATSLTKRWSLNRLLKASKKGLTTTKKSEMAQTATNFRVAVDALAVVNKKLKSHLASADSDEE
ncbi:MAG: response regulator [Chlamydiales bacterium]|nr:response regulator [Chlamydiales bacterium]